ncbi:dihydropteroate synthase [Microbacterium album]|uniref:Dihydropteroate synthase n=2 Tax=Microbacterium album TaxID=2053191 RepID=A0A917IE56_9MICO|nr:dihydropteroate synthase [Microbacterium album]
MVPTRIRARTAGPFDPAIPLIDERPRRIGRREFDFARRAVVMAIVNRTPDSFHDRGRDFRLDRAVEASLRAVSEGAEWVDIGGVPFGRGPAVSEQEELDRVVPTVEAVAAATDAVVSVDTTRAAVAAAAIAAGASVINDTSGFWDPQMPATVARGGAAVVLTHSLNPPRSEPVKPEYDDVVEAVVDRLRSLVERATEAGIPPDRLIVDPGHDLNKNTRHSLELIRRLPEVVALGHPTLVALSHKDFVGETLDRPRGERLPGSLAAATACVLAGARIVRAHDVRPTVDAVRMAEAVLGIREPALVWHNNGQN